MTMGQTKIERRLAEAAMLTETAFDAYFSSKSIPAYRAASELAVMQNPSVRKLSEAMNYSLLAGGKRIRPYLVLSFCRMLDGDEEKALPLACALEAVHTYSLIHDDLPCVDNDDLRRGRPTSHKVYGEAGALFAGDALLTLAFLMATDAPLPSDSIVKAIRILSECAGVYGMLGGQMADTDAEKRQLKKDELVTLHSMKTGALMRCAVRLGCLAAGVQDEQILNDMDSYASDIGLAFQIVDDILDKYGESQLLGKTVGSDTASEKTTFLSFYTREEAFAEATRLTERAIETVSKYQNLQEAVLLAEYLLHRQK